MLEINSCDKEDWLSSDNSGGGSRLREVLCTHSGDDAHFPSWFAMVNSRQHMADIVG